MPVNESDEQGPDALRGRRRYQFSVRVDPGMLRRASMLYMWRRLRWRYLAGWAGVGLGVAAHSMTDVGTLTTILGVVTAALAIVLLILPSAVWIAINRTVKAYRDLTGGAPVFYEVDDEWLVSRYANGSGELRWSTFRNVIKSDEVWLLVSANEDRFIPLPVAQVPEEALLFIDGEIAAHAPG
mgnify:CR=1 FL=1